MIGVIGGTSLYGMEIKGEEETVETRYGQAKLTIAKNAVFLQRHGESTPPHKVNHKANLYAFKEHHVDNVISVCSSGSLKKEISPPCLLIPHDYINFYNVPTYFDEEIKHVTPGLDERLRQKLIAGAKKTNLPVHEQGVYFQATGPRLETKAEIMLMRGYADLVGMTMAAEATLAKELGLNYACLCSVDNYANGITEKPTTYEGILENSKKTQAEIQKVIQEITK